MERSQQIKRILVVDDQEVARTAISAVMEKHGYVDTADNGQEALSLYVAAVDDDWSYDLICLDVTMPGLLNGYQVVRCVRAHEEKFGISRPVPVVIISSHDNLLAVARKMNTAADDYITKPFTRTRLDEIVQRFLH